MELEKLLRSLLYRLESIDDESVIRFLSAKHNYNIIHPEGENETIVDNKSFYLKKQFNNKLQIGNILEIMVTKNRNRLL